MFVESENLRGRTCFSHPLDTLFNLVFFLNMFGCDLSLSPLQAVVFVIAALPVLELRGAVPVGLWMGMPVKKVMVNSRLSVLKL